MQTRSLRRRHRTVRDLAIAEPLEQRLVLSIFTVTNANDSGPGSLRDILLNHPVYTSQDVLLFDPVFFATPRTISLLSALPRLGFPTVKGPGSSLLTIRRDPAAATNFRILDGDQYNFTMSGITIQGGRSDTDAAGLYGGQNMVLDDMVFIDNRVLGAGRNGGAIGSSSCALWTIRNSIIVGNSTTGYGGGIYCRGDAMVVENSTIAGNTSGTGGGIFFLGGYLQGIPSGYVNETLVIRNSTISNNTASGWGGGVYVWNNGGGGLLLQNSTLIGNTAGGSGGGVAAGSLATSQNASVVVQNSTITNNTANSSASGQGGGGIAHSDSSAAPGFTTIINSVVSGNSNANAPDIFSSGVTTNANFSAIGSASGFALSPSSGNNLPFGADLRLGALADNGGPTKTIAPLLDSPLIDAGSNADTPPDMLTDQRGPAYRRTFSSTVDIGAVETQPPGLPTASATASDVNLPQASAYKFSVTYLDATGTNNGINFSSIVGNNNAVHVIGPGGFDAPATYLGIDTAASGSPRTATYAITPPGGTWDQADNGLYAIQVLPDQIHDIDGNSVSGGNIGQLNVNIPRTYVVTNLNDSGSGSLRQAILDSNAANDGLPNLVVFQPGLSGTIKLTSGEMRVNRGLAIVGPGPYLLTIDGNLTSRIFNAFSGMNISGLRFINGRTGVVFGGSTGAGGAIRIVNSTLMLSNCVFENNAATGTGAYGGAVGGDNNGVVIATDCVFDHNSAAFNGGAIFGGAGLLRTSIVDNTAQANGGGYYGGGVIDESTIARNRATISGGGGIVGGALIRNSTITGNFAGGGNGGGIQNPGYIQNSTITGNSSNFKGGGIGFFGSNPYTMMLEASIISGNTNFDGTSPDIFNSGIVNATFSAIGNPLGFTLSATSGNNLPFGTDLQLGPLADNGGPTQTMMPASTSPLINAARNLSDFTDQRGFGFSRKSSAAVDIGAVEVDSILPAVQTSQFNYTIGPQSIRYTFSEPVTLDKSALELHNVSTNQIVPLDKIALTYDSSTHTATFTFPGYPNGVLPNGDYRAFLRKDGVQDSSHNHPAIDHMTIFAFLLGDLNGDRSVSIADFITLASNFNKTGATYPDGDLNYDGIVSISDFIDFASKFGASLPPPPPAAAQPAAAFSVTSDTVFSPTRHTRPHRLKHHHHRPHLLFRFEKE